jgi:hypothetical protein
MHSFCKYFYSILSADEQYSLEKNYYEDRNRQHTINLKVRDLNTMIIERYQGKFLSTHKPATTNRLIACLKHMITKAVDWDMASEDTLRRIRKVKNLAESNKRTRFLNVNEC